MLARWDERELKGHFWNFSDTKGSKKRKAIFDLAKPSKLTKCDGDEEVHLDDQNVHMDTKDTNSKNYSINTILQAIKPNEKPTTLKEKRTKMMTMISTKFG